MARFLLGGSEIGGAPAGSTQLRGPIAGAGPIGARAAASGVARDPYYPNVSALLDFNNEITDFSNRNNIYVNNGAIGFTRNPVLGPTSKSLGPVSGAAQAVSCADGSVLGVGTGDWFAEIWGSTTAAGISGGSVIMLTSPGPESWGLIFPSTSLVPSFQVHNATVLAAASGVVVGMPWCVAYGRKSGVDYMFLNGDLQGTVSDTFGPTPTSVFFAGLAASNNMLGFLIAARITLGFCRQTASYTLPALPLPTS